MNTDKKTLPVLGLMLETREHTRARRMSFPGGGLVRWVLGWNWSFLLVVVLPTAVTGYYYGFVASDIYISESNFLVQSVSDLSSSSSSLGSLLKSSSGSSDDDTATVQVYMQSRDALRELEQDADIRKAFSSPAIDRLSRFNGLGMDDSFEALFRYYTKAYGRKVVVVQPSDVASTVSQLVVRAFTAKEANLINRKLLDMGEKLVNTLNDRMQADLVRYAQAEVDTAEKKAEAAYVALAEYRNKNTLVDPEHQSSMQLQLILTLQEKLIETRNQIAQLSSTTANNPQIPGLQNMVKSLESEIASELTKATGDTASLTNKASDYERLTFERDFSQKALGEVLTFLDRSRNDAQRKLLYLKRISEPSTPDVATEPRRLANTFTVFIVGMVFWGIISLFTAAVREHQQ